MVDVIRSQFTVILLARLVERLPAFFVEFNGPVVFDLGGLDVAESGPF